VMEQAMRVESGGSPQSTADEIAKLAELRSTGAITDEEYQRLKQRALA
jgi:Short C-terminal domain